MNFSRKGNRKGSVGNKMTTAERLRRTGKGMMRMALGLLPFLTLLYTNGFMVSANYGQNAANWMLDQVFWIALVAIIIAVAALAAKRNNVAAISVLIVGAVVLFFIKNPTKLSDIGNSIMSNVLN